MNETLVIVGPTAVGKTKLSIYLAKRFQTEIINGDAFQVYRGMDIGTAKVTRQEAQNVPHHLIDICDPSEPYTVADYQIDARRILENLSTRGKMPIIVGGTGFYIKAALYDYHFGSTGADHQYRLSLARFAEEKGKLALHERLKALDPDAAKQIHPNNLVRVMRALEVIHETGRPFSRHDQREISQCLYPFFCIGLTLDRALLYARINARVDQMIENGLINEVRALYDQGLHGAQAMQAIGYKEFIPYFDGRVPLADAIDQLKKHSRHYAKRQYTWFNHQMPIHWIDMTEALDDFQAKAEEIHRFVKEYRR
ncbi:tRNA (adenosine(37)-N6)-dimethylallyltransferase MiaA [Sporolactobacillus sp. CPB3-1]|uniref:tRNA dimethylallyltransferase n=1 Tax=Sporolactobacillus mangiferae TaxID=2940498 RepID=A0ABT0M7H1_9BACL|nr:tRNA (adenosine(37)-N6)-dimethylallyltransferase MiaA [Sporolactobacillus mangiferae]MCL1630809.1 tRNA (adenosine(37)-N6)-dimethylallyltransferase MiaA [Sporolactobacillus mangiferae]